MNNVVISGEYKHYFVRINNETPNLKLEGASGSIEISKDTISNYEVRDIEYKRGLMDILARIIIGYILIGPIGLLAVFTASRSCVSFKIVYLEFKDGKKSLIKIDNKIFKTLVEIIF
jgi:hypothetical protein